MIHRRGTETDSNFPKVGSLSLCFFCRPVSIFGESVRYRDWVTKKKRKLARRNTNLSR